ncbi:MAG: C25 family cysteine peptidase, partial [Planctomycetaceae bacterium]|nr:C25 family cysteine peptidase [Planctomycetaceae bacterium]
MFRYVCNRILFFVVLTGFVTASEHVVVVCPQAFHRSLEPWIKYRSSQGYTVHVLSEPLTTSDIKNRIRFLADQVSLSAVLLVGKEAVPSPQIPCRVVQHFGKESFLASDDWYADLNNDGVADFAVGRFAANTATELDCQIRKTIRYETEIPVGIWCRQFQMVAGTGHFSPLLEGVVESTTRYALTETIPESYDVSFLYANWKSPFCPAPIDYQHELIETLNRSPLFWVYFGHGHPQMLDPFSTPFGSLATLQTDDFPQLRCQKSFPVVFLF